MMIPAAAAVDVAEEAALLDSLRIESDRIGRVLLTLRGGCMYIWYKKGKNLYTGVVYSMKRRRGARDPYIAPCCASFFSSFSSSKKKIRTLQLILLSYLFPSVEFRLKKKKHSRGLQSPRRPLLQQKLFPIVAHNVENQKSSSSTFFNSFKPHH